MPVIRYIILSLLIAGAASTHAQKSANHESPSRNRKWILPASSAAAAAISLAGLNSLWYAQYPRTSLRSFNDNHEWMQMDKVGHLFTCHQVAWAIHDAGIAAGYSRNASLLAGSLSTLGYMTTIELLDGHSAGWGFSWGDMAANVAGISLFTAQQLAWNDQRIQLRFSYSHSPYASLRPALLGRNFQQRLIKDYNAQTYWCSFNIHRFLASGAVFPKWLNVAIGYGATGMTRSEMNEIDVDNFQRSREYYFSFDADLNRIQWPRRWMKITARVISFIKIPGPTLEVRSDGKVRVHALFF
ncbi:MAG: DUF2279 domain-containing protein [Flavobacteriales bacterium]|jgi:uncharacterized protein YfiM (DUF2279 family)